MRRGTSMIRVIGTGMSGFAFPTAISQVRCYYVEKDSSLKPIQLPSDNQGLFSYGELAYMVPVVMLFPIRDVEDFLEGLLYYKGGFFSGGDHKGFGTLAVYRDGGLFFSESLYRKICKRLGYGLSCVRWGGISSGIAGRGAGVLGSAWWEYGSFEGGKCFVRFRSLYSLMSSYGMYDRVWSDFRLCWERFGICMDR